MKGETDALDQRELTVDEEFSLEPKKMGRILTVSNLFLTQSKDPNLVERALLKEYGAILMIRLSMEKLTA